MLRQMKAHYSSGTIPDDKHTAPLTSYDASAELPVPEDADALRALAWLEAGAIQTTTDDDAVPVQTKAELDRFRPASYRRKQTKA